MRRASLLLCLSTLVLAGAACVHTGFTPTAGLALPPRPEGCYLDLILQGSPPFPYVVIGQISTDSTMPGPLALAESNDAALQRMKDEACRVGAHGLLQVGANSQGSWTQDGLSKSTTGGAVAFVYVDPTGRPLRPPRGPHVVIHPGAYPPPGSNPALAPTPSSPAPPASGPPPSAPASSQGGP